MNKKTHFLLMSSLTLLVLIVSAVQPGMARADDNPPPPPPAPASSGDTSSASNNTQASSSSGASDSSSSDTQSAPAADGSTVSDSSAGPSRNTDSSQAGATAASAPAGTSVVVLDANGTPVPLGTKASANIIANGDPQFCTSLGHCGASETTIGAAVADAYAYNFSTGETGTITVSAGAYAENVSIAGGSFTVNGSSGAPSAFSLVGAGSGTTTLNGFIAVSGMKDFTLQGFTISGNSPNGTYVSIDSNNGTLVIQDVNVTNTTSHNNGRGISVTRHYGNIHLSSVVSNGNTGVGAYLDNCVKTGFTCSSSGDINVDSITTTSTFNGNGGNGLEAYSNGAITVSDIVADNNGTSGAGSGAVLDNSAAGTSQAITVNNGSVFNGNYNHGLNAKSAGDINLDDVLGDHNGWGSGSGGAGNGATLDNTAGPTDQVNVNVTNSSFGDGPGNGNGGNGLQVNANGPITLDNDTADYNNGDGAYLSTNGSDQSILFDGSVYIDASLSYGPTFNDSEFSYNAGIGAGPNAAGLEAYGPGSMLLFNVTADCNGSDCGYPPTFSGNPVHGLYLDDSSGDCASSPALLICGIWIDNGISSPYYPWSDGEFWGNSAHGIDASSMGDIFLDNIYAEENNYNGAYLNAHQSVYIDDIYFGFMGLSSDFSDNLNNGSTPNPAGLEAYAHGDISLYEVTADDNGNYGAYLENDYPGNPGGIYVNTDPSGVPDGGMSDFSDNDNTGIQAYSRGDITLTNVTAGGNDPYDNHGGDGAILDNSGGTGGVYVNTDTTGVANGGTSDFSGNDGYGLEALSPGNIALENVVASDNTYNSGAYLYNNYAGSTGTISIDQTGGTSDFSGNGYLGLEAYSRGDISLANLTANRNDPFNYSGGGGAWLENDYSNTGSIGITSGTFNGNIDNGLWAYSNGDIRLTDVTASGNDPSNLYGGSGATLDNHTGTGAISVDLGGGTSDFSSNNGYGLLAYSTGAITLNSVSVNDNLHNSGALLRDDYAGSTGAISIDQNGGSSSFNRNGYMGLEAYSLSNILLTNVTASDGNPGDGAYLDNCADTGSGCTGSGDISVNGGRFGDPVNGGNVGYGLYALSDGNIALANVTASNNTIGSGAYLLNNYGGSTGGISIGGTSNFNGNGTDGLEAYSNGTLTLSGVTAGSNHDYGSELNNVTGGGNVSISNSRFNSNITGLDGQEAGLDINTNGNVSLSSISASNNLGGDGMDIDYLAGSFASLGIQNSIFNNNFSTSGGWGMGLYAINGSGPVTLLNVTASGNRDIGADLDTSGSISIDPSTFNNNGGDGLYASSGGSVTLVNVTANNNGGNGASLSGGNITVQNSTFDGNTGTGLYMASGDATLICSIVANNSGYGLDGTVAGTLTLDGDTVTDNIAGDNNILYGSLVENPYYNCNPGGGRRSGKRAEPEGGTPLPWNTINVQDSGDQGHGLDCTQYSGTELMLPNGDHVLLPCPIGSAAGTTGTLSRVTVEKLPGKLDSKFTFISAFDAEVTPPVTSGMLTVGFKIPLGNEGSNFTILHWDGTQWVSLGGSPDTSGYFNVQTGSAGFFVLVVQ